MVDCPNCGNKCVEGHGIQRMCFICGHGFEVIGSTMAEKKAMKRLGALLGKVRRKVAGDG